jgi:VWFA-related protein
VSPLALVLAAALPLPPQEPPSFSAAVEAVYIDVFVTDGTRPVTGLSAGDFELRDNGRLQPVALAAVDTLPLTTYVVLDTSGSVKGPRLVQLQAAVKALVGGLPPAEAAALMTFDDEVRQLVPRTTDRRRFVDAVDAIRPGGATSLFDALYAATLLATGRERALIVLFTDGQDTMSWLEAAQVRRVLEESNVLLQAVTVLGGDEPEERPDWRTNEPESKPEALLRHLAELTGGRVWPAASPHAITDAFLGVLEAMEHRYLLRFEPPADRNEGRHQLDVKLTRRKGRVHYRRTYVVRATTSH